MFGALIAGLFGIAFDQITVSISPEYFVLGKQLDIGELRAEVAWLGFRSALPLGAVLAGMGALRAQSSARFGWPTWLARIAATFVASLVTGALILSLLDPFDVREESASTLMPHTAQLYLLVWGLHIGAYAGCILGGLVAYVTLSPNP